MKLATLEQIQHGSPEKNIAFYNHIVPAYDHSIYENFVAHWHTEYEFIYVFQGPVSFILNDKIYCLESGHALFINKNVIHASIPPSIDRAHYVCVTFGEHFIFSSTLDALYKEYFFPLLLEHKQIPPCIKGTCDWQKNILAILRKLCRSGLECSRGCELEWRILLLQIFHIAYVNNIFVPQPKENESNITAVQSAILAIQRSFTDTIQISQLARDTGFSTEYFCRIFKSTTGKTPTEYINAYRLQKAEYMLTHTSHSVTDIATACGFNDINYFSRYFKRIHQTTPSQYRKNFL